VAVTKKFLVTEKFLDNT